MGNIKQYQQLTYIETYDGEICAIPVDMKIIAKLIQEQQFLQVGNELINRSHIKRVFTKEVSDVDKVIYSIDDKIIRNKIIEEINRRTKD